MTLNQVQSKYLWLAAVLIVGTAGYFLWRAVSTHLSQGRAARVVELSVRGMLTGDLVAIRSLQVGDELDRLGVSREEFLAFRSALLSGYLAPDAKVSVTKPPGAPLAQPRNEFERKMKDQILNRRRSRPQFVVTVDRSDGKPPIQFQAEALQQDGNWVVSQWAILTALHGGWSDRTEDRFRIFETAMEAAKIHKICSPDGEWITIERARELAGTVDR